MERVCIRDSRLTGYGVITVCYIIAAAIGVRVYLYTQGALWLRLLAADAAATLFIWTASYLLHNASVYDPYWSVQPMFILTLLMLQSGSYETGVILIYGAIMFWGIRLTGNWAYTFGGLERQDWRYDKIKERTGRLYQIVNLLGIQMMPTFIVYLCILPAAYYIINQGSFHPASFIGIAVSVTGAILQTTADKQLHTFRKITEDRSLIITTGLWKYSRHPNYLGEILMWWGVYLAMLPSLPGRWYLLTGALLNSLLFLFISIPMAEKNLASYKNGYEEYKKKTRMLLPIPK